MYHKIFVKRKNHVSLPSNFPRISNCCCWFVACGWGRSSTPCRHGREFSGMCFFLVNRVVWCRWLRPWHPIIQSLILSPENWPQPRYSRPSEHIVSRVPTSAPVHLTIWIYTVVLRLLSSAPVHPTIRTFIVSRVLSSAPVHPAIRTLTMSQEYWPLPRCRLDHVT